MERRGSHLLHCEGLVGVQARVRPLLDRPWGRDRLVDHEPGNGTSREGHLKDELFQRPQDERGIEREAEELGVGGQGLLALDHQPVVVGADDDSLDRVLRIPGVERDGLIRAKVGRGGKDETVDEVAGNVGQMFDAVDVEPRRLDRFLARSNLFSDGGGDRIKFRGR